VIPRIPALLIAALAAVAAPAAPLASQAPSPVSARPESRALVLARIVAPLTLLVDKEIAEARRSFDSSVAGNPRARAAEAAYPGLYAYAWRETEPLMRTLSGANYDSLHKKLAAMFDARLTPKETEALIAYYSSPLGQRSLRTTIEGIRVQPEGLPPARTPGLADRAAKEALASMSAADEAAVLELSRHIGLDKFRAIGAEVQRIELQSVTENERRDQPRVSAAIQQAIKRYMAASPRRRRE
jgi:hypothetical protein